MKSITSAPTDRQHAHELVRNGAQDGVERQQVPLGHDVRRRHQRVGRDRVVGFAQRLGQIEHEDREHDREQRDREGVLHRVVGVERQGVGRALHVDAGRIVVARHVQRPDVQGDHGRDHERQQIVQREEAVQRRLIDREAAPQAGW